MCFPLDYFRVKNVTSSSGVYVGLQTLADIDGERLWKKLYFRLAITLLLVQLYVACLLRVTQLISFV